MLLRTNESQIDYADGMTALGANASPGTPPTRRQEITRRAIIWFLAALLSILLIALYNDRVPAGAKRSPSVYTDTSWVVPLAVYLGLMVGVPFLTRFAVRWALPRSLPKRAGDVRFAITEQGIRSVSETGELLFRWSFFSRYAETDRSFAIEGKRLNIAPRIVCVIPKSAATGEDQIAELRKQIHSNVFPEARLEQAGSGAFPLDTASPEGHDDTGAGDATPDDVTLLEHSFFEHEDFAVSSVGWRRRLAWNRWHTLIILIPLLGAFGSVGIAAYLIANHFDVFWAILLVLPMAYVWVLGRTLASPFINLAGERKHWRLHAFSYGPASIILRPGGILLRSVQHELLYRDSDILAAIESHYTFSLIGRYLEIVIPKRMLSAEATQRVRQSLAARFPLQTVSRGNTVVIAPPLDGNQQA